MATRRTVNPLVTKPEPVKKAQPTKKAVKQTATTMPTKKTTQAQPQQQNSNSKASSKVSANVGRVGNVGSIQDLAFSAAGKAWIRFSLAYSPYNPQTKEQGETVWYDCICFGFLAENVAASISQGMRVVVAGRPQINKWTDDDGETHSQKQILCDGVGPDLLFATAEISKINRRNGSEPKFFEDEETEEEDPF